MRSLIDERWVREIRMRIGEVRAEDRGLWGRMSAAAMVCHLREAFRIALGEQSVTPVKLPLPGGVVKVLALWAPMQRPKNVETVPELKMGPSAVAGILPGRFEEDHAGLVAAFERFVQAAENRTDHAMLGRMSPKDWMRWGYLHTDHHLRQFGR